MSTKKHKKSVKIINKIELTKHATENKFVLDDVCIIDFSWSVYFFSRLPCHLQSTSVKMPCFDQKGPLFAP